MTSMTSLSCGDETSLEGAFRSAQRQRCVLPTAWALLRSPVYSNRLAWALDNDISSDARAPIHPRGRGHRDGPATTNNPALQGAHFPSADVHAAMAAPRRMKIRFAADCADATDSRGFFLILSAFIRPICVICGESALLSFASFFLCALATLRLRSGHALREIRFSGRSGNNRWLLSGCAHRSTQDLWFDEPLQRGPLRLRPCLSLQPQAGGGRGGHAGHGPA